MVIMVIPTIYDNNNYRKFEAHYFVLYWKVSFDFELMS
jgi:hypothetical protein